MTEKQEKFLEAYFGEAGGDERLALELAGYAPDTNPKTVWRSPAIQEAVKEKTHQYLARSVPLAAVTLVKVIEEDGVLGAKDKLAAIKELLDRVPGYSKTEKVEVEAKSPLFILPAKTEEED